MVIFVIKLMVIKNNSDNYDKANDNIPDKVNGDIPRKIIRVVILMLKQN